MKITQQVSLYNETLVHEDQINFQAIHCIWFQRNLKLSSAAKFKKYFKG